MGLNNTPSAERLHIGIFGKTNAGKSSVVNAITRQSLSIVSDIKGTTTDPVKKTMEMLPLGPVVIIDTPGIDDEGELGEKRVQKSYEMLNKTDIAVIVVDGTVGLSDEDNALIAEVVERKLPYVVALNKSDMVSDCKDIKNGVWLSAKTGDGVEELKKQIILSAPINENHCKLVGDLVSPGDLVILVIPIDKAAPKGRLILPQQMVIRDLLDANAIVVTVKEDALKSTIDSLGIKPKLVITDSQVFDRVAKETPEDVLITSFSILMARYKGTLQSAIQAVKAIENVKKGDKILVSEGCTHHRQCGDIGTVKIPNWLKNYTGEDVELEFSSGTGFPKDLTPYKAVIHCGGCMLNEKEMKYRELCAKQQGVPMTNYGIFIAYVNGILARSLQPFSEYSDNI
jgi:[FeFe] hydrogenase H-cluster maturation GTPase HydF